uniref:Hamartin n=1 Tax=Syphacia muris TaxID=451379 RepID=A0A0N5ARN1_9BILA
MNVRTHAEIVKLIRYSESLNSKVSEDSREALRSLIDQGEAIGHLVQYYSSTQSFRALDLLCRIKEPHDTVCDFFIRHMMDIPYDMLFLNKHMKDGSRFNTLQELCNRMQDCFGKNPLATIILLGQIVQKAPSWLTKLCEHPLFVHLLKLLNELSRSRWSQREAHDFSADCRHVMVRPVNEDTLNVLSATSQTHSESSTVHINFQFDPKVSNSHSSSNYQWSDPRWGESWSPSINLGIETPPGTRTATPVTQKVNIRPTNTIVPGNSGSLNSFEESEETRKHKRGSFSQKFVDLVRGRKSGGIGSHSKDSIRSSLIEKFEATKEEMDDIIVIDAIVDDKSQTSLNSHVEEAVDAVEANSSPVSLTSDEEKKAFEDTSFLRGKKIDPHQAGKGEGNLKDSSVRSRSVSTIQDTSATPGCDRSSSVLNANLGTRVFQDNGAVEDVDDTNSKENLADSHSNRFSVTSFFRTVNRQRFISECPPKSVQAGGSISDGCYHRKTEEALNHRSNSCPDLLAEKSQRSNQYVLIVDEAKKTAASMTLSVSTIAGLIEKEFPYLRFLRTLPFSNIDEDALDSDLKVELERTRELYMKASLEHHMTLKRMYLADRLPAKIYDDMSNLIQGLPLEKQREILISRLALVNQHLMYERSGRLLHAERNRRLFGRIKQQKLCDVQILTLQKELHSVLSEREQLVNALSGLRKEAKLALRERQESESRYCDKLRVLNSEIEKYKNKQDFLKRNIERLVEENEKLLKETSKLQRRCEDEEVTRKLIEVKLATLEALQLELHKAHEANQSLRDKLALSEIKGKKQSTAINPMLSISGERDERVFVVQLEKLKKDLLVEQNANDLLKQQKAEIEEQCKAKKEKCADLKALLERSALVHKQQSDAAQHKYLSLLSVCQKQQAHILELCAYIEQLANKRTSSADSNTVPIPRGNVPEEILSFNSIVELENTLFFADAFSPADVSNTSNLFEFSPNPLEDSTEKESRCQSQATEQS